MTYFLGVDLGTSYTAAAISRDGVLELVSLGTRSLEIPSVAFLDPSGAVVVGESAERRGASDPTRLAREFKRRLGDPAPILVSGTPFSAEALMATVLRSVVADVTARQGEPPAHVTLTRPANWGPYKQELFSHVPVLADLGPSSTATEPEAAAVHFASTTRVAAGQSIAVYDLGGGTFDAAVLRKVDDGFTTLGTPEGIEHLGGADFDDAVFEYVRRVLGPAFAQLDPTDPAVRTAAARLRAECVLAKESLSRDTEATIPVALPGLQTEVRLTRQDFEDLVRPALMSTVESLRRTVRSARVPVDEIAATVLAGGSSRIPLVAELITGELQLPVAVGTHPKHTVALGAALLAARDAGRVGVDEPTGRWNPGMIAPVLPSGPVPTVGASSGSVPVGATWETDQKAAASPPSGSTPVGDETAATATGSGLFGMPNQTGVVHEESGRRRRSWLVVGAVAAVAAVLVGALLVTQPWKGTGAAGNPTVGTTTASPGTVATTAASGTTGPTSAGRTTPSASGATSPVSPTTATTSSATTAPSTTDRAGAPTIIPTGANCGTAKLGVLAALQDPAVLQTDGTGEEASVGAMAAGMRDAVQLAVDQFNEVNPGCVVTLAVANTENNAKKSPVAAAQLVKDDAVVGVVTAAFSSDIAPAGPVLEKGGLPFVVTAAKAGGLNGKNWKGFVRVVTDDAGQGTGAGAYVTTTAGAQRVGLVVDGAAYGAAVAGRFRAAVGDRVVLDTTVEDAAAVPAAVAEITGSNLDFLYFAGKPSLGRQLLDALRRAGFDHDVMMAEAVTPPRFVGTADPASVDGTLYSCSCAPMDAVAEFSAAYRARFDTAPTAYAPEAYDATVMLLRGISEGHTTRADLRNYVRSYDAEGITKLLKFDDHGYVVGSPTWIAKIAGGQPVAVGLEQSTG